MNTLPLHRLGSVIPASVLARGGAKSMTQRYHQDASMPLTLDPSWTGYKRALARLADAGQRLDSAQAIGGAELERLEREFQAALRAYDSAREQMDRARAPDARHQEEGGSRQEIDGQMIRMSGLASSHQDWDFAGERPVTPDD